jgi:hypothetical protein
LVRSERIEYEQHINIKEILRFIVLIRELKNLDGFGLIEKTYKMKLPYHPRSTPIGHIFRDKGNCPTNRDKGTGTLSHQKQGQWYSIIKKAAY